MDLARLRRNQKQAIFLEEFCSGLRVIPEIPPSPPFSKGGLGGISEKRFPPKYSLQNLESLHVSSTNEHRFYIRKRPKDQRLNGTRINTDRALKTNTNCWVSLFDL
jgi:hypothetical protein